MNVIEGKIHKTISFMLRKCEYLIKIDIKSYEKIHCLFVSKLV